MAEQLHANDSLTRLKSAMKSAGHLQSTYISPWPLYWRLSRTVKCTCQSRLKRAGHTSPDRRRSHQQNWFRGMWFSTSAKLPSCSTEGRCGAIRSKLNRHMVSMPYQRNRHDVPNLKFSRMTLRFGTDPRARFASAQSFIPSRRIQSLPSRNGPIHKNVKITRAPYPQLPDAKAAIIYL